MLRATLKSLLARKLRLVLSGLAVVLSVMFVGGSFVLTDTLGRSFDALFSDVYTYTDIQVLPKPKPGLNAGGTIDPSLVDDVEDVPGVASVRGEVSANGARVIGKNGKVLPNQSGTNLGANWVGDIEMIQLSSGGPVESDNEIVVNQALATAGGFTVGDSIDILTPGADRRTFALVGIFTFSGGRESIGGEFVTFFSTPVAQELMLGEKDVFNIVDVTVEEGASLTQVRDDIQSRVGGEYEALTGEQLAAKAAQPLKEFFKYIQYVLLGFGAVALLVGVFLILNTFSIIVAQRTQELALLRAMGASRRQVIGSVLVEAVLIGLVGSTLGFLAGVGLGYLGAFGLGALAGGSLEIASVGVPLAAVLLSFGVGIGVTVVAAIMPALRAARVAPVAALRAAANADRPLMKITIAGALVTAAAGGALAWGLSGAGDRTLPLILGGVLGTLIGVALLTPIISRPVVSLLGVLFAWSIPGQLGRRNSARNPRRTAITAAAIMIGITLVTAISTVFTSLAVSINKVVEQELQADLVIAGQQVSEIPPTLQPAALEAVRDLPAVDSVAAYTADQVTINGRSTFLVAVDDLTAARHVLKMQAKEGSIDSLDAGELLVDERTAKDAKVALGDSVRVQMMKGEERRFTVVGISKESNAARGFIISIDDARDGFRSVQPMEAYIKVKDGASVDAVKGEVDTILQDSPEMSVATRSEYAGNSTSQFDFILYAVQILLLVAMAISVLGVINTLVLSVIERTRELGMLRAIGLRRSQTMRMITVESVVISLFGTLLGLIVGAGLGAAIVVALREALGFGEVALPWLLMAIYLVASLFIGVLAAVLPAIRAARLNVLGAIAYE
ncbi:MAG TPA: FtsX-like permease family protein [Micromonosporaceae bacterium]|nr:FtsX-like permease family protein [Micromonosporaceae bacterium]